MRMRKKLSAIINTPDIPTGFTELEYLESNERQYIKTDYIFTNQDEVSCVAELLQIGNFWANLFGCLNDLDPNGARLFFGWMAYNNTKEGIWAYGKQKSTNNNFTWNEDPALKKMKIQLSPNGNLHINDILISTDTSDKNVFPTTYPAYLFAINNKGNMPGWGQCYQRIFSFNIKRAGTPVLTLIPVLDEKGTPCMYDMVSGQCFLNAGSGTFGYKIKNSDIIVAPTST